MNPSSSPSQPASQPGAAAARIMDDAPARSSLVGALEDLEDWEDFLHSEMTCELQSCRKFFPVRRLPHTTTRPPSLANLAATVIRGDRDFPGSAFSSIAVQTIRKAGRPSETCHLGQFGAMSSSSGSFGRRSAIPLVLSVHACGSMTSPAQPSPSLLCSLDRVSEQVVNGKTTTTFLH